MDVCSLENCKKRVKSRGMCSAHYEAWRIRNRVEIESRKRQWYDEDGRRLPCLADDCSDPNYALGLCSYHYSENHYRTQRGAKVTRFNKKWKRLGISPDQLPCSFEGCLNGQYRRELCSTHLAQLERDGELRPVRQRFECPVRGCPRDYSRAAQLRMCIPHTSLARRMSLSRERVIDLFAPGVCSNPGCGNSTSLHVDHDHACCPDGTYAETGKVSCGECVRGVLCMNCNVSLGRLRESPERIRGLATYLEQTGG